MNCCRFRPSLAVFLLFGVAQAAAVLPSALTCNFTHLSDGSFRYQLSKPISSPDCERYWVDDNQVVIARDSSFEKNLVVALTNRSITLRNCSDHLHYTQECNENHDSVHCRVNCSGLLEPEPLTTVNTTLTCLVGRWCPTGPPLILGFCGVFFLLAGAAVVLCFIKYRRGRGQQRALEMVAYSPASQQVKAEI